MGAKTIAAEVKDFVNGRSGGDAELTAMRKAVHVIDGLPSTSRGRVLNYLVDRFCPFDDGGEVDVNERWTLADDDASEEGKEVTL